MKATIWSAEFKALCGTLSDKEFEKTVNFVDDYASERLKQNNTYLNDLVSKLFKDVEIAKAENAGLRAKLREIISDSPTANGAAGAIP